jgi:hypothetical protein
MGCRFESYLGSFLFPGRFLPGTGKVFSRRIKLTAPWFDDKLNSQHAGMVELVDALDSKSSGATHVSSSLTTGT